MLWVIQHLMGFIDFHSMEKKILLKSKGPINCLDNEFWSVRDREIETALYFHNIVLLWQV